MKTPDLIDRAELLRKLNEQRDAYISENFMSDPETGTMEGGRASEEYLATLDEQIEAITLVPAFVFGAGLTLPSPVCDTPDSAYDSFWRGIVEKDGIMDAGAVKRELFDFLTLMRSAALVYCHVTGNQISKLNTAPEAVTAVADDVTARAVESAIREFQSTQPK